MPLQVRCECGQAFRADDKLAGKRVRCPQCQGVLEIPVVAVAEELGPGGLDDGPGQLPGDPLDPLAGSTANPLDPLAGPLVGGSAGVPSAAGAAWPGQPATRTKASASRPAPWLFVVGAAGGVLAVSLAAVGGWWLLGRGGGDGPATSANREELVAGEGASSSVAAAENSAPPAGSSAQPGVAQISEEELRKQAEKFEQAVASGSVLACNECFDFRAIVEAALDDLNLPDQTRQELITQFANQQQAQSPSSLMPQTFQKLGKRGRLTFLRPLKVRGQQTALFRVIGEDGTIEYRGCVLRRSGEDIKICDIYLVGAGEFISETLERAYLPVAAQLNRGVLQRLTNQRSEYVKQLPQIAKMLKAVQQGEFAEVLRIERGLPEVVRSDKNICLIRCRAARAVSEEEFRQALEYLVQQHPDDREMVDLMSIDLLTLSKRFAEADEAVQRLDTFVGGDPYLTVLRASLVCQQGRAEEALAMLQEPMTELVDVIPAQAMMIYVQASAKDYAGAVKTLQDVHERFGLNLSGVAGKPELQHFAQSPEFRQWLFQPK